MSPSSAVGSIVTDVAASPSGAAMVRLGIDGKGGHSASGGFEVRGCGSSL
jgi:hypothetical protein